MTNIKVMGESISGTIPIHNTCYFKSQVSTIHQSNGAKTPIWLATQGGHGRQYWNISISQDASFTHPQPP